MHRGLVLISALIGKKVVSPELYHASVAHHLLPNSLGPYVGPTSLMVSFCALLFRPLKIFRRQRLAINTTKTSAIPEETMVLF